MKTLKPYSQFSIKKLSEALKIRKNSDWPIFFCLLTLWIGQLENIVPFTSVKIIEAGHYQLQSVKMKTNQITSFHVYLKRNLKDFGTNETVKIY